MFYSTIKACWKRTKISHSPIKNFCTKNNIPIYTPENFTKKEEINSLKNLNCDVLVVAAYGIILPKEILEICKFGALNIHASLLPRWRGAAPIQRAILAGDEKTGITIMKMNVTDCKLRSQKCRFSSSDLCELVNYIGIF